MARPKKKPGYDREAEIADLIATAAALFDVPYDDREPRMEDAPTIKYVAEEMQTTAVRVRKLLISANMYSTAISRRVQELDANGHAIEDIMSITGLGKASVYSYLPFKKGAYNLPDPTLYSEQTARYRNRKRAVEEVKEQVGFPDELICLWKCVIVFENYPFMTAGRGKREGLKFKYTVSRSTGTCGRHYSGQSVEGYGNEIFIQLSDGTKKAKSISRSTVELGYRRAREAGGVVKGPKALGLPGAGSYVYPLLVRFGVIKKPGASE